MRTRQAKKKRAAEATADQVLGFWCIADMPSLTLAEAYDVLELPHDASQDDAKRAYKKLALRHHPDKGGSTALERAA